MLYAFNGGILSTENEDNFVRNLATIKVGDAIYTVPLWPYSAIPPSPMPTRTKKQKLSESALGTPIFTVDELKQWLHVDDTEDDVWMLPLMEAAAHLHVQNYLRIDVDDTCGENIRIAMLTLVGHWYRNREAVTIGARAALEVPMMFAQLLAPERDYSEAY